MLLSCGGVGGISQLLTLSEFPSFTSICSPSSAFFPLPKPRYHPPPRTSPPQFPCLLLSLLHFPASPLLFPANPTPHAAPFLGLALSMANCTPPACLFLRILIPSLLSASSSSKSAQISAFPSLHPSSLGLCPPSSLSFLLHPGLPSAPDLLPAPCHGLSVSLPLPGFPPPPCLSFTQPLGGSPYPLTLACFVSLSHFQGTPALPASSHQTHHLTFSLLPWHVHPLLSLHSISSSFPYPPSPPLSLLSSS